MPPQPSFNHRPPLLTFVMPSFSSIRSGRCMIREGTESRSHSAVHDKHSSGHRCHVVTNEVWLHKPQQPDEHWPSLNQNRRFPGSSYMQDMMIQRSAGPTASLFSFSFLFFSGCIFSLLQQPRCPDRGNRTVQACETLEEGNVFDGQAVSVRRPRETPNRGVWEIHLR